MSYADKINWHKSYGPKTGLTGLGTGGAGVTMQHFTVDGFHIMTKLTVNGVMPAVTGTIGVGLKVFEFPAGVHSLKVARMSIALTAADGNIDDDTPELSLGSVIVVGAVATMTTATWEDILTAQVAVCDGTVEEKTLVSATAGHIVNEAAGVKNVFLNMADIWAGAEANCPVTGEIWLEWTRMSGT